MQNNTERTGGAMLAAAHGEQITVLRLRCGVVQYTTQYSIGLSLFAVLQSCFESVDTKATLHTDATENSLANWYSQFLANWWMDPLLGKVHN